MFERYKKSQVEQEPNEHEAAGSLPQRRIEEMRLDVEENEILQDDVNQIRMSLKSGNGMSVAPEIRTRIATALDIEESTVVSRVKEMYPEDQELAE